jgi:hypothetical protein
MYTKPHKSNALCGFVIVISTSKVPVCFAVKKRCVYFIAPAETL